MIEGRSLVRVSQTNDGSITVMYDVQGTTADERLQIYGLMEIAKAKMIAMERFAAPRPPEQSDFKGGLN